MLTERSGETTDATATAADDFRSPARDALLASARSLRGLIEAEASEAQRIRHLTPRTVSALRDRQLFAALAPREVGGLQVDPITEMELIESISYADGSTGWAYMIGAGSTARVASQMSNEAASEVFAGTSMETFPIVAYQVLAGSGRLRYTQGGYVLSGRWPFGTGVNHADWIAAVGTVDGTADELACIVPASDIVIHDNWNSVGLRASGSNDYEANDVFVPTERTWLVGSGEPVRGGVSFSFKRAPIKHLGFTLGVSARLLSELVSLAARKLEARPDTVGARGVFQHDIGYASVELGALRAAAIHAVTQVWAHARVHGELPIELEEELRAVAAYVADRSLGLTHLVERYAGASTIGADNVLQRCARDLIAAAHHAEVSNIAFEAVGRWNLSAMPATEQNRS